METYLKAIQTLEFRKEKLMEQARRIEHLLSGRYIHYYPFMQEEQGVYSERKTWQMVEELLEKLKQFDKFYVCYDADEEEFDDKELKNYSFGEREEAFCRSFLYCVLRWGYSGAGSHVGRGNFVDLIEMAEEISKNKRYRIEELLYEETYEIPVDPFYTLNDLYSELMQQRACDTAKEEDILSMRKKYQAQVEEIEKRLEKEKQEKIALYGGDMTLEEIEEYEEKIMFETADDLWLEIAEAQQQAIEHFAEKEIFAKQYLIFRETFFQVSELFKGRMKDVIEGMLDIYLNEKNISQFLTDELFFQTYAMISKTVNYVAEHTPTGGK